MLLLMFLCYSTNGYLSSAAWLCEKGGKYRAYACKIIICSSQWSVGVEYIGYSLSFAEMQSCEIDEPDKSIGVSEKGGPW